MPHEKADKRIGRSTLTWQEELSSMMRQEPKVRKVENFRGHLGICTKRGKLQSGNSYANIASISDHSMLCYEQRQALAEFLLAAITQEIAKNGIK